VVKAAEAHPLDNPWYHRVTVITKPDKVSHLAALARKQVTRHYCDEPDWERAALIVALEGMHADTRERNISLCRVVNAYQSLVEAEEALAALERDERP
jgi:hypothetical protein